MCFTGLLTERIKPERVAHALDNGGFSCPSTADQDVKIAVKMNGRTVQKSALPC